MAWQQAILLLIGITLACVLAQSPSVTNVYVSPTSISNGATLTIFVEAESEHQILYWGGGIYDNSTGFGYSLVFGGPDFVADLGNGHWKCNGTWTPSIYLPSGTYYVDEVYVETLEFISNETTTPVDFQLTDIDTCAAPLLESATLSTLTITNGGTIYITVDIESQCEVTFVEIELSEALIYYGPINQTGLNQYESTNYVNVSEWVPSGTYNLSFVAWNSAGASPNSEIYPIVVNNQRVATTPVISGVEILTPTVSQNGGVLEAIVTVQSNAPLYYVEYEIVNPYGGYFYSGIGAEPWNATSTINQWTYDVTWLVSEYDPTGTYTLVIEDVLSEGWLFSSGEVQETFEIVAQGNQRAGGNKVPISLVE